MRILAIADVHGSKEARKKVDAQIRDYIPNIVIVDGDITQFGPPAWAEEFLNSIMLKTLALPGNCDPRGVLEAIENSQAIPLHAKKVDVGDYAVVGLGGSNATPFGTPFELSEDEIYSALDDLMVEGALLVVHAPPKGHVDKTSSQTHSGSQAIADIISKYSPPLVISAHIHEARGVEREGATTYVNPGPASRGYAAVIDLNGEVKVELIQS
ncbi:MAG: metallophosphoesterase family protein [Thermoplasmata archaeon]|nr:MAG: metallophosphoesterase family protein [Thermoplasmata archaeon]